MLIELIVSLPGVTAFMQCYRYPCLMDFQDVGSVEPDMMVTETQPS